MDGVVKLQQNSMLPSVFKVDWRLCFTMRLTQDKAVGGIPPPPPHGTRDTVNLSAGDIRSSVNVFVIFRFHSVCACSPFT